MPPGRRSRLEPRARVHDVTGDDPLAELGPSVERDERLAGVHADPNFEREHRIRLVHLGDRLLDRERSADGALRVVFVRDRGAEDTDDGVPDELLDRTSMPLEFVT